MYLRKTLRAMIALLPFLAGAATAAQLTDVAGRTVTLDLPAKRVLVGEARQVHVIAALKGAQTFDTIVGWRDDMIKKDPDSYAAYLERFPAIAKLPRFGYVPSGDFSLEAAIALHPDVLTLNIESREAARESGLEEKAESAGIHVVYVDFRTDPDKNTEKSIEILGQIFGAEDKAQQFIAYRRAQIAIVTDRLAAVKDLKRPSVFMERAPGNDFENGCCRTFGPANFGKMVDVAGGHNIADGIIKTTFGTISLEQLIVANPDQIIMTGSNWSAESKTNRFVPVGRDADVALARARMRKLMERTGFDGIKAVQDNNVHAVWHQFYSVPYEFVVIQQFAKWFHPKLFADLDPDQTFREFHEKFLPIAYKPGYFVSLEKGATQ